MPDQRRPARPTGVTVPLEVDRATILAALETGDATPLSPVITDIVRYRNQWWIAHVDTWLLINDPATAAKLDRHTQWTNPVLWHPHG